MRKNWPLVVSLGALGVVVGVVIAGRSAPADSFVISPSATTRPDTATTVPATAAPASTAPIASPTTPPAATTSTSTVSASTVSASTVSASTVSASTVSASTASTTGATPGPLERSEIRLVIANGDGRFNLATANANRLRAAGYVQIDETDVGSRVDATIVYFRPGFDGEALVVAADLGLPGAIVAPLGVTPITIDDDLGDVIVVLGPDALR